MASALSSNDNDSTNLETTIKLSVITLSFHRADSLLQKLEALNNCDLDSGLFEVVIGFNDCDAALEETIRGLELPFQIQYIMFANNLGISKGRNTCIEAAQGEIIYFSDDDCVPDSNTLSQHLNAQKNKQAVYIGSILFKDGSSENSWQPKQVNYWNVNGANTSVPKDAIQTIQGFDESLEGYGGEDILLGYQLKELGFDFLPLPTAWTTHLGPNPALAKNTDKAFSAGYNAFNISKKLPASVGLRLGVHPLLLRLKQVILNPFVTTLFRTSATVLYEKAYLDGALKANRETSNA